MEEKSQKGQGLQKTHVKGPPHLPVPLGFHLIFEFLLAFEFVIGHPMHNALRLPLSHHIQNALVYQPVPA